MASRSTLQSQHIAVQHTQTAFDCHAVRGNRELRLKCALSCPSRLCGACRLGRAADVLEDAASELQAVITVVEATSQPMSRRDQLRGHMDTIYKYAQDKSPYKPSMVPRVCSHSGPPSCTLPNPMKLYSVVMCEP